MPLKEAEQLTPEQVLQMQHLAQLQQQQILMQQKSHPEQEGLASAGATVRQVGFSAQTMEPRNSNIEKLMKTKSYSIQAMQQQ